MQVEIHTSSITVGQFLKLVGAIGTGGQVKNFLAENTVLVNGEGIKTRGKKIFPGDAVMVEGVLYEINCVR